MRTFSKSGLAGLRLGYLIGSEEWISELEKIRLPYNINSLSQRTAEFILENNNTLDEQAGKICKERKLLVASVSTMSSPLVKCLCTQRIYIICNVQKKSNSYTLERVSLPKIRF